MDNMAFVIDENLPVVAKDAHGGPCAMTYQSGVKFDNVVSSTCPCVAELAGEIKEHGM